MLRLAVKVSSVTLLYSIPVGSKRTRTCFCGVTVICFHPLIRSRPEVVKPLLKKWKAEPARRRVAEVAERYL